MRILLAALILSIPGVASGQRAPFSIPDPDPEIERESFQVADGFEVNLFAADPMLAKPVQMNFDPKGRLWVVSSEVYPQILPGQAANDKVLILEDRDGDGRAERTTVFADGLLIPTGIEPGDGGAYVANSTELLHFRDSDDDGKADARRVVLSGFGTEDTHHILHTLRWGFDGLLYFNQSIYIHSHIETPHGVRRLGGGGIWQFRPETRELDVFIRGLVNPWGHHYDRWGQSFATDGAGGEGINYCLPGASYFTAVGATRLLPGLNPGSPKYCGEEVVSGGHFPEDWRGNILTNDFRGNRVCRFVISDDGAGFAAREQAELIRSRHVAFRPIDVKMGPDGAVYIADWYNPIIQHGEVDFRDPRRDHTRGRIWRVSAKGRPTIGRPRLVGSSTEDLLAALEAPEDWTRHNARRVLKERGGSVVPALAGWAGRLDRNDPEFEHRCLEALWTYQALDVVEPDLLASMLQANDPRARAAAVRVVGHWHRRLADPLGMLERRVVDVHPRVRLEAVRALARVPGTRAAVLAMKALDRPVDRFLDYALWLSARELQPAWLPEVLAGRFDFDGDAGHLVFALLSVGSPEVVRPLEALIKAGGVPRTQEDAVLATIASQGGPADLGFLLDTLADEAATPTGRRASLLGDLLKATRQRGVRPEGDLGRVGRWLDGSDDTLRALAAQAVGLWRIDSLGPRLVEIARTESTPDPVLRSALDSIAQLGGKEGLTTLRGLAGPGFPARTRAMATAALWALDVPGGASLAVEGLAQASQLAEIQGLLERPLRLKEGPQALEAALSGKSLPSDTAKLAIRVVRGSGRDAPKLIEALGAAGGLSASAQPPSADQLKQMAVDVARLGDAARGEVVFRAREQSCLKCHAIAGAGGQVGPGLESVGASAQVDYLIESLLVPSKAIKENYHAIVVATQDGKVVTGIKLRETDSELVVRDAEDHEVTLALASIDERKPGGSLMPAGLADSLTRGEFLDLVRFLSELGKIGPYSVAKAQIARRWRVLEPTQEAIKVLARQRVKALIGEGQRQAWVPAYSEVSGLLPLEALPPLRTSPQGAAIGVASTQVEVSTAGAVRLAFNSADGLTLWIDGDEVAARPEVDAVLAPGVHTLTVAVDLGRRHDGLRCTLEDVPGSSARAQVVLGK